jgi:hypothetical protein
MVCYILSVLFGTVLGDEKGLGWHFGNRGFPVHIIRMNQSNIVESRVKSKKRRELHEC